MLMPSILSNNILQRSFQDGEGVTPMKLQKLLYFVSCEYVKRTSSQLFKENFEVWQYGPVLPTVYQEFKSFGKNNINSYSKDADGNSHCYSEAKAPLLKSIIDDIWCRYKAYSGQSLSAITHTPGSGWSSAYQRGAQEIGMEDMANDSTY